VNLFTIKVNDFSHFISLHTRISTKSSSKTTTTTFDNSSNLQVPGCSNVLNIDINLDIDIEHRNSFSDRLKLTVKERKKKQLDSETVEQKGIRLEKQRERNLKRIPSK